MIFLIREIMDTINTIRTDRWMSKMHKNGVFGSGKYVPIPDYVTLNHDDVRKLMEPIEQRRATRPDDIKKMRIEPRDVQVEFRAGNSFMFIDNRQIQLKGGWRLTLRGEAIGCRYENKTEAEAARLQFIHDHCEPKNDDFEL